MKKIVLTSLLAVFTVVGAASASVGDRDEYGVRASVFNPAYRPLQGDWSTQFGIAYQTGRTESGSSLTDFGSGDVRVGDVKIAYGLADDLYVSLDTAASDTMIPFSPTGNFANPELGINWQIMRPAKSFAMDLVAKYGFALTKDAATDERIGMNNLQAGLQFYGDEGMFQWRLRTIGQYVFLPDDNTLFDKSGMWNLLLGAELEYEIVQKVGLKGEFNYNIYNLDKKDGEAVIYDPYLSLGLIMDITPAIAAIQPYVAYHFETQNSSDSSFLHNSYWQIGAKFGIQF